MIKRKTIIDAKKKSWESFRSDLETQHDEHNVWRFTKRILGKNENGEGQLLTNVVKDRHGTKYHSAEDKTKIMLKTYKANFTKKSSQPLTLPTEPL